jgi:N-acetylglucosaminyl-diphospho-decaprenol L-rhamnosyltransferase
MTARRIAAVLVHYGDPRRTIRAVLNHWKLGVFSDIIVIANDQSRQPQELKSIPCTWLIPARNIGFGSACQLGAAACRADIYAFFNAHITIDRASIDRCIEAFDIRNVGIASPHSYYPGSGRPRIDWKYTQCTRTYSRFLHFPISVPLKDSRINGKLSAGELLDSDWAPGAVIFCRYEVIRDVGWDGSYFLGVEDVDICMRAKRSGWRVVVVPSAIAFHTGESSRTSTMSAYYAPRNSLWFARKYHARHVQAFLTLYFLLLIWRIALADMLKRRRPPNSKSAARGIWDGWRLWPGSTEALPGEPLVARRGVER